jgi:hypothetical protein
MRSEGATLATFAGTATGSVNPPPMLVTKPAMPAFAICQEASALIASSSMGCRAAGAKPPEHYVHPGQAERANQVIRRDGRRD